MSYRNIFLLELILAAAFAACNQNSSSPKDTAHHKPNVSKKSSTLTKKIAQKELELRQMSQALEQVQTQLMNSSQHEDDALIQPPPEIQRTSRGKQPFQPTPERIYGSKARRESDRASLSSLKDTPQTSSGESIDGCDGSVASSFRETETALDSSFEEILERGVGSSPTKMSAEVLQDDGSSREALHIEEKRLGRHIKKLDKELDMLRKEQQ